MSGTEGPLGINPKTGVPFKVLVIDDSKTICRILSEGFSDHQFVSFAAFKWEDSLPTLQSETLNLVICDLFMPGSGGLAGISHMRDTYPELPVIAISAGTGKMPQQDALAAARKVGADGAFAKPFDMEELVAFGRDLIDQYAGGRKPRVLVVDDARTIRKFVSDVLRQEDFIVHTAEDMESALSNPEIVGMDVVVSDIFMPGIGGIEGIAQVRKNWPEIPVIAMSGGHHQLDKIKALMAAEKTGAVATLKKPFTGEELVATVIAQINAT